MSLWTKARHPPQIAEATIGAAESCIFQDHCPNHQQKQMYICSKLIINRLLKQLAHLQHNSALMVKSIGHLGRLTQTTISSQMECKDCILISTGLLITMPITVVFITCRAAKTFRRKR